MLLYYTDEIPSHGQLAGKLRHGSPIHSPHKIFSYSFLRCFRFQNWMLYIKRLLPYEARQYNLLGWKIDLGENVSTTYGTQSELLL